MKNKENKLRINATKRMNLGMVPLFVQLGHKGLEKSMPVPIGSHGTAKTYIIPKDILKVSVSDPTLYEDIERIEFTYDTKK